MTTINIRGTDTTIDNDTFYRYKMPKIKIIQEKSNVMVLSNIGDICKALNRDIDDVIKFIKKKINQQLTIKNKGKKDEKIYTITSMDKNLFESKIIEYIYAYIQENVLCKKCNNPETVVNENNTKTCKACGQ